MSKKNRNRNNVAPVVEQPVVEQPVVEQPVVEQPVEATAPVVEGYAHDLGKNLTRDNIKTAVDAFIVVAHEGATTRSKLAEEALALAKEKGITKTQRGNVLDLKRMKSLTSAIIRDIDANRGGERIGEKGWWSNYEMKKDVGADNKVTKIYMKEKETI